MKVKGNPFVVRLADVPLLEYPSFTGRVDDLMADEHCHCVAYYAFPLNGRLRFFCCLADDLNHEFHLLSHEQLTDPSPVLESLTPRHPSFHIYERELAEDHRIRFEGHPWLKPLTTNHRPPTTDHYPFYSMTGDGLHEVGVGPIHAGVIEPGHFRFICKGEKVLHLEIALGYQHRGVEKLMLEKTNAIQRAVLSENIAGDTAVGHSLAHAMLNESLSGTKVPSGLMAQRIIALEMERIAVHIGDTAALCTDIAYQFGQVVNEALRTIVINTTQSWCGNRFGKGLVRPAFTHYLLTDDMAGKIMQSLKEVEERYYQMTHEMFNNPSVLSRFEGIGKVSAKQAGMIGATGMAARSSGVKRDLRWSHPFQAFGTLNYEPRTLHQGDVWARAMLRRMEVESSLKILKNLVVSGQWSVDSEKENHQPLTTNHYPPTTISLAAVEGWRGEIVHSAVTGEEGNLIRYKIKDPSLHNWMALALAVREQEISDFPLCNKSFNLSYCGNDL
jgi:Ni,Fe-hydrogenase III large subunit